MSAWFSDVIILWGPQCLQSLKVWLISRPRKNLRVEKVKFWLVDPDPKIWDRGPLMLGALVRDPRVAPNAERMVALSVSLTEKIAIEKNIFNAL